MPTDYRKLFPGAPDPSYQPGGSNYGQPVGSSYNLPSVPGYGQPSGVGGLGYNLPSVPGYGQPSGVGGLGYDPEGPIPTGGGAPTGTGGGGILGTGITWQDILDTGKDIAPYVLGGAATISAIGQQNAANDLRKEALDAARQDYASRDPLRTRALSILTGAMPTPPNLSALRSMDNPYAASHTVNLPLGPVAGLPMPPVSGAPGLPSGPGAPQHIPQTGGTPPTNDLPYRPRTPALPPVVDPNAPTPNRPGRRGVL